MRFSLLACALSAATLSPALAEAPEAMADVALIDGWRQADGSRLAAIEIRLTPGWHTYWRVPGDAGVAPEFDWSRSRNLASVAYEWPRPEIFESYGMVTFGYAGRMVLPVHLVPVDAAEPIELALDASFGVCKDICTRAEAEVTASIDADAPANGRDAIEAALAERARTAREAGVAGVTCTLAPSGDGYELMAEVVFGTDPGPGQRTIFEPGQADIWVGSSESRTDGRTVLARAPVEGVGGAGPMLERGALRVTVLDGRRAVDIRGCGSPAN